MTSRTSIDTTRSPGKLVSPLLSVEELAAVAATELFESRPAEGYIDLGSIHSLPPDIHSPALFELTSKVWMMTA